MLPPEWRQVCGKPAHGEEEHTAKCMNWICPQGQRYRTWPEVQAYFQLLSFEEDIPGVECRPENAKLADTAEEEVTLEEAAAKRAEGKRKAGAKTVDDDSDEDHKAKGRKKKEEDEDYKPDQKDLRKVESKPAAKRTRRSLPAGSTIKKVEPKLPCTKCGVELESAADLKVHTTNFHGATLEEAAAPAVRGLRGAGSAVTISEVKAPEAAEAGTTTNKLFLERFEVFKAFCASQEPAVEPVAATEHTLALFLDHLAKKKGVNKSVQEGYRQAVVRLQAELRAQRSAPGARAQAGKQPPARPPAPKQAAPAPRQPAPTPRQAAPVPRQSTPAPRQSTPAPRQTTPAPRQAAPAQRQATPRQAAPAPRQTTPAPRQAAPAPRQQVPVQRQAAPTPRQAAPRQAAPRQAAPAVRQAAPSPRQAKPSGPQYSQLPSFLVPQVSFPCRLEANSGGGESLYRAAAQHIGLGQEGYRELRRYCHTMLLKWWQWYEPYYAFPLQVKVRVKAATVAKSLPSAAAFKEFLKSEESLQSSNISECETYCLANVLGVAVYQLTFNLAGATGRPEQRCKWDTLEPHQGLMHTNKFARSKEPLYVLHEDKVSFTRMVQTK